MSPMRGADFGKVGVLFGGRSGEREISLMSGAGVPAQLQQLTQVVPERRQA